MKMKKIFSFTLIFTILAVSMALGIHHYSSLKEPNNITVIKLETKYDKIPNAFQDGLAYVKKNDKTGIINTDGKEVVPAECATFVVQLIHNGRILLHENGDEHGKCAILDSDGNMLTDYKYDSSSFFSEGLLSVKIDGEGSGYLNVDGNEVIPLIYGFAGDFKNGLARVSNRNGEFAYIDTSGNIVIPFRKDLDNYSEGLLSFKENGKYGYIDVNGNIVIPAELEYEYVGPFVNGRAYVQQGGKYGFIDTNSALVIPVEFDMIDYSPAHCAFENGVASIKKNGKWGIVDRDGNIILPIEYNNEYEDYSSLHLCDKFSVISKDGKVGAIDNRGNILIPIGKYDKVFVPYEEYHDDFIIVEKGKKTWCIDASGQIVFSLKSKYDGSGIFSDGLAIVQKNKNLGFMDITGKDIIPCKYDEVNSFSDGCTTARIGKTWYILKKN